MQNILSNGFRWYFRMICVRCVYIVTTTLAHIRRERLFVVRLVRVVGAAVDADEVLHERIRAGRVIGWVGERQDVLVRADRKALDLAKLWITQLFAQLLNEVGAPLFVAGECLAQALDGAGSRRLVRNERRL